MASRCAGVRFKACAEAGALAESCGGACAAAIADIASSNAPATELVMEAFMTSSPRPDRFGRPNRFRSSARKATRAWPGWFRENSRANREWPARDSPYRKIEIGRREGLAAQREVPPFLGIRAKSAPSHGGREQGAVVARRRAYRRIARRRARAEGVEGRSEIELGAVGESDQPDVDGRATRMAGMRRDVAEPKQRALVERRIELGLAPDVAEIARPAQEMRDRPRRPIAVEHLEAEAAPGEIMLHLRERADGRRGQQADRPLVAVDAAADQIALRPTAPLDRQPRHLRGRVDEGGRAFGGMDGGGKKEDAGRSPDGAKRNPGPAPETVATPVPHFASPHAGLRLLRPTP